MLLQYLHKQDQINHFIFVFKVINIAFEKRIMAITKNKCFYTCCLMTETQGLIFAYGALALFQQVVWLHQEIRETLARPDIFDNTKSG